MIKLLLLLVAVFSVLVIPVADASPRDSLSEVLFQAKCNDITNICETNFSYRYDGDDDYSILLYIPEQGVFMESDLQNLSKEPDRNAGYFDLDLTDYDKLSTVTIYFKGDIKEKIKFDFPNGYPDLVVTMWKSNQGFIYIFP